MHLLDSVGGHTYWISYSICNHVQNHNTNEDAALKSR